MQIEKFDQRWFYKSNDRVICVHRLRSEWRAGIHHSREGAHENATYCNYTPMSPFVAHLRYFEKNTAYNHILIDAPEELQKIWDVNKRVVNPQSCTCGGTKLNLPHSDWCDIS